MRIDTHMHLWELGRFGYGWLESVPQLQQDFRLEEVLVTSQSHGIENIVLIEADNSLAETKWLLEIAAQNLQVLGVVGWVDIGSATLKSELEALARDSKFCGVRIGVWPQTDLSKLGRLLDLLQELNLSCDVLMGQGLLKKSLPLLKQFPNLTFVLNHCAGADFTAQNHREWAKDVSQAATLPKVYMKLSGFVGESVEPYLQTSLEDFGPERLMFGSDYPVCTLRRSYAQTVGILKQVIGPSSTVWGATAQHVYGGHP